MKVVNFRPTYIKKDGLEVIYLKSIPIPERFVINNNESGAVVFPSGAIGGNHKNPCHPEKVNSNFLSPHQMRHMQ